MNKYQAQIRHINGDLLTVIWDDNKKRFQSEIRKAKKNINEYIECPQYNNDDLFIKII